ncbi:hypothetical protein V9K67_04745 [Paraflavisolibacter sp. H34]|uniref:hypothetical protein n=1 Tax=Huijunlia imazamoxiresistens TaxID=3127457 RepID=UPI00301B608B
MKTENTQLEILFRTATTLSQREWCEKDGKDQRGYYSEEDRLEDACWNGFLDELIPEVLQRSGWGRKLVLWTINRGPSLLHLHLGESVETLDNRSSLDPHRFLPFTCRN